METYMKINVDIDEVGQDTQISNQAWKLIHR